MRLINRFFIMLLPIILFSIGGLILLDYRAAALRIDEFTAQAITADIRELVQLAGNPLFLSYFDNRLYELEREAEIDLTNIRKYFADHIAVSHGYGIRVDQLILLDARKQLVLGEPETAEADALLDSFREVPDPAERFSRVTGELHQLVVALGEDLDQNRQLSGEEVRGFLLMQKRLPREMIRAQEQSYFKERLNYALGCLLVLCVALIWVARTVTQPLQLLAKQASAVGRGQKMQPFSVRQNISELQTLASVLSAMLNRDQQQRDELSASNQSLREEIAERKRAERALQQTYEQLLHEKKLSAIGRLSASIAHEFNNPLQGVMTVIQGVKKRATLSADDEKLLGMAGSECERMKNLIRGLQDFYRPSSGRQEPMDLHAALDSLLLLSKKEFSSRGIVVNKEYGPELPPVWAVTDQIKQVLLNLINNGVDACETAPGSLLLATERVGDEVLIRVKDSGKGMDAELLGQIFDPFFTTKAAVKGTGLGLSISYGIVKQHGGRIEVESEPEQGSEFRVYLPIEGRTDGEPDNPVGG